MVQSIQPSVFCRDDWWFRGIVRIVHFFSFFPSWPILPSCLWLEWIPGICMFCFPGQRSACLVSKKGVCRFSASMASWYQWNSFMTSIDFTVWCIPWNWALIGRLARMIALPRAMSVVNTIQSWLKGSQDTLIPSRPVRWHAKTKAFLFAVSHDMNWTSYWRLLKVEASVGFYTHTQYAHPSDWHRSEHRTD